MRSGRPRCPLLGQRASLRLEWERLEVSNADVDLVTLGVAFRF